MATEELKCECGCNKFESIIPYGFPANDFRIWHIKDPLKAVVQTVPVARCLACSRILIPSASLAGKNALDPEVIAYGELYRAVEFNNSTRADSNVYPSMITELQNKFAELTAYLTKRVMMLEKELEDVKASRQSGDVLTHTVRRGKRKAGTGSGEDTGKGTV